MAILAAFIPRWTKNFAAPRICRLDPSKLTFATTPTLLYDSSRRFPSAHSNQSIQQPHLRPSCLFFRSSEGSINRTRKMSCLRRAVTILTGPHSIIPSPAVPCTRLFGGLLRVDRIVPLDASVLGISFPVNEKTRDSQGRLSLCTSSEVHANAEEPRTSRSSALGGAAKSAGSPTLNRPEAILWDGPHHPLSYIIALGRLLN